MDKSFLVLMKSKRPDSNNIHRDVYEPELTQLDEFKHDQRSEERFSNNSTQANENPNWKLYSLPEPSRDKNQPDDTHLDTVNIKVIREHEIAVSDNNECSESPSETVTKVEKNLDDGAAALYRGGVFSKPPSTKTETKEEATVSSKTFPEGNSYKPLISEEEGQHVREEMASLKLIKRPHHRPREPSETSNSPPRPYSPVQDDIPPPFNSAPKLFLCTSPEYGDTHRADCQQSGLQEKNVHISGHMMCHPDGEFKLPRKLDVAQRACAFIPDTDTHQLTKTFLPLHWLNDDFITTTHHSHEENHHDDDDYDPQAVFRGPGS